MRASVVTNASIVARLGAIIPTPFALPPTRYGSASAVADFGTVSVVMMARAKSSPPVDDSPLVSAGSAAMSSAMCKGSPMTPVEHGRSSSAERPASVAAASVAAIASRSPRSPVAAFA